MKYLVIGLGSFGRTLAEELTDKGHDVIGIDHKVQRVEEVKDRIALSYVLDSTEKTSLKALPLRDVDGIIVAIGQSMDASLRTVAALKELTRVKIYARAIDETHQSILSAMEIRQVFIPEYYAARHFADTLTL